MRATSGAGLADGVGAGLDVGRGVWGEPARPRTGELGDPVGAARVHAASATSRSATMRGSRRVARDVTSGTLAGVPSSDPTSSEAHRVPRCEARGSARGRRLGARWDPVQALEPVNRAQTLEGIPSFHQERQGVLPAAS